MEVKALPKSKQDKVVEFLYRNIFVRYYVLQQVVTNQGSKFTSQLIQSLAPYHKIHNRNATHYLTQENG